jgi:hypothetical protein
MPFSTVKVCATVPANQRLVSEMRRDTIATISKRVQALPVRDRVRYVGLVLAREEGLVGSSQRDMRDKRRKERVAQYVGHESAGQMVLHKKCLTYGRHRKT